MQEKLRLLIERRMIEANEKKVTTKLYAIAKQLGGPIINQFDRINYLQDVWRLPDDDTPEEVSDESGQDLIGYYYDGMKCGVNLCIKALIYEDTLYEIKASYNGYLVYHEEEGHLKAYAPFPQWETDMEMFYEASIRKEQINIKKDKEEKIKQNKKKAVWFFDRLRTLWNY